MVIRSVLPGTGKSGSPASLPEGALRKSVVHGRSATKVPCPVEPITSPSRFRIRKALTTVAVATPWSCDSCMISAAAIPGHRSPDSICARSESRQLLAQRQRRITLTTTCA